MKLRMPDYYKKFSCIADKCRDSCCIGWEIEIDNDTANKYQKAVGSFGEKLRNNISGGCFVLDSEERCPFLNPQGLCDIIIEMGEENLCQICQHHPRYFEWFKGIKEGGIGLSCEEAARIILTNNSRFGYYETETDEESCDEYDEELFDLLFKARNIILNFLQNKKVPVRQRLLQAVGYAERLQKNLNTGKYLLPEEEHIQVCREIDFRSVLEFMQEFEPMEESRPEYLSRQIEKLNETAAMDNIPETELYLENIAVYFIWRYFMKGVFDGEILSKVRLAAVSTEVIGNMFRLKFLETGTLSEDDCVILAKTYSKEIEYSEENISDLIYYLE